MKNKVLTLSVLALFCCIGIQAQDDDMYFTPSKKAKATENTAKTSSYSYIDNEEEETYDGSDVVDYGSSSRSIDEYNRRDRFSRKYAQQLEDSLYEDSVMVSRQEYEDYVNSKQLQRWDGYNGLTIIVNNDPWYDDPWYYDSWYWRNRWYSPWYDDPWYYGGYWGYRRGWFYGGYYGYYRPWGGYYRPWGGPYYGYWGGRSAYRTGGWNANHPISGRYRNNYVERRGTGYNRGNYGVRGRGNSGYTNRNSTTERGNSFSNNSSRGQRSYNGNTTTYGNTTFGNSNSFGGSSRSSSSSFGGTRSGGSSFGGGGGGFSGGGSRGGGGMSHGGGRR